MNSLNLTVLRHILQTNQHRALVILSGQAHWQNTQIVNLWHTDERVIWISDKPAIGFENTNFYEFITAQRLPHQLGQEVNSAILDASQGLSANTLGIVAGMIKTGGLFILLTPSIEDWRNTPNPCNSRFLSSPLTLDQAHPFFIDHLIQQWKNVDSQVIWHTQFSQTSNDDSSGQIEINFSPDNKRNTQNLPTIDQQKAIQAIHTVAFGHRKRPLVISADRGRGKSSVLGLAAIECLRQGKNHIIISASRLDQAKIAFLQATNALNRLIEEDLSAQIILHNIQLGLLKFEFKSQLKVLEFIPPDQLIITPTQADLLMVDEASHLPIPVLAKLLNQHHRMVFATTLQGYEGSGQGFKLCFKKTLSELTPNWKNISLKQPIRWADNDPLEYAINHGLFLNTSPDCTPNDHDHNSQYETTLQEINTSPEAIQIEEEAISLLSKAPERLHAVFQLLVQAHYQTSPNDLQQLLSAPNLKIITAYHNKQLLGVMLCVEEGKIMSQSAHIHGHLVPQLLTKHYALVDFLALSSWRVMRIAVHPKLQRQSIGKQLLQFLQKQAKQAKIDYISSSFGVNKDLLPFWFQQGYQPIYVGVKHDKASGSHNLVVTKALTPEAQKAISCIQSAFQAQFPHSLLEYLPNLHTSIILDIMKTFKFKNQILLLDQAIQLYATHKKVYETMSGQLWEWSIRNPQTLSKTSHLQKCVWSDKVFKKLTWQQVAEGNQLAGRKAVEKVMREMLIAILP